MIDTRGTWTLEVNEPISGNFYPINAKIVIEDNNKRLAIITDRSQGGSSMVDGTVEIMVHRRLLNDDAFGVGEALNETAYGEGIIARGKHWLIYTGKKNQIGQERLLQNEVLMSNWLFFDDVSTMSYDNWQQRYTHSNSSLGSVLPENIYLMTFEPWKRDQYLIRFEHIIAINEDTELSQPVTFDLIDVFPGDFEFAEVTLAGVANSGEEIRVPKLQSTVIKMEPMQMRTFVMTMKNHDRQQLI